MEGSSFAKKLRGADRSAGCFTKPKPMTMVEKIVARKLIGKGEEECYVSPGDAVLATVDGATRMSTQPLRFILSCLQNMEVITKYPTPQNLQCSKIISSTLLTFQGMVPLIKDRNSKGSTEKVPRAYWRRGLFC